MHVLVTGAAGFIGSFVTHRLLSQGETVIGLDNLNDYYDPALKEARLACIGDRPESDHFEFIKGDITDYELMQSVFKAERIDRVVHLAAAAGVRHSIKNPHAYAEANLMGFLNILECGRHNQVENLVYASTSSVYGSDTSMPFSEHQGADHPLTFYAATKRANELMAHSYASLFGLSCTGLRFFTVYGPWGRPDMALFLFTKAILEDKPINLYNNGNHERDFTFVEDIVSGIVHALNNPATAAADYDPSRPDPAISNVPWRVYNIGNGSSIGLMRFVEIIEAKLGRKARINMLPMQPGDVFASWSDTADLARDFDYVATTSVEEGVGRFVDWYLEYYKLATAR